MPTNRLQDRKYAQAVRAGRTVFLPASTAQAADAPEAADVLIREGVTTIAIGVDGGGDPEVAKQRAWFEERGVGTNLAPYVGFARVRESVLGAAARVPGNQGLDRMRRLVAKAMCEGAFGSSTGLFHAPQSFATTDEVMDLAHEAAIRGGLYRVHPSFDRRHG